MFLSLDGSFLHLELLAFPRKTYHLYSPIYIGCFFSPIFFRNFLPLFDCAHYYNSFLFIYLRAPPVGCRLLKLNVKV